jgi:hypothetical protein
VRKQVGRLRTPASTLLGAALFLLFAAFSNTPSARADFGFQPGAAGFDVSITQPGGGPAGLAGSHPYEMKVDLGLNTAGSFADGDLRDLSVELPPGLLLNPTATAPCVAGLCTASSEAPAVCAALDFNTPRADRFQTTLSGESCPDPTQVGTIAVTSSHEGGETRTFGLFNLAPPHGAPMAIGASPYGIPVVFTPRVREADAGLTFSLANLSQAVSFKRLELTLWGTPWDYDHDGQRGDCLNEADPSTPYGTPTVIGPSFTAGTCSIGPPSYLDAYAKSLITLPAGPCGVPLDFAAAARSWQAPGTSAEVAAQANGGGALSECKSSLTVPKVQLSTAEAGIGSGLVFTLEVSDGGGILNPKGVAVPAIKRAVVSLPEGLTINPAVASGLEACTSAQFAEETADPAPGEGCPNASKVGTVAVEGMLGLAAPIAGSLFLAQPYENPLGSQVALYIVVRSPARGLLVKSVGALVPDPHSGRLVATFDQLPRLLYTRFTLSLREGLRSVFVSPPACGPYATDVQMHSWAGTNPHPLTQGSSTFNIDGGPGGGPCPGPGLPPFAPALKAGSINPNAGSYTPFYLQMTRTDAEQEITSYSATFPPGLLGRIAAIPYCPAEALEAAKSKSAAAEIAQPSCPAGSEIGRTVSGYGVGGILAYAPGRLYLAGPYHGAPLSVVAIDAALIGPFDLGVVAVRSAIRIDPATAQASIDAAGSDPIPHILAGIPIHLRDVRVFVDRPNFTLNPTDCSALSVSSRLSGAGTDLFDSADDTAASATTPYGLLDCTSLGFSPKFALGLRGGTKRGAHPSLRAVYVPRAGDVNLARAAVTLPPSLFLAQEHIRGVCTQAQLDADACPPDSAYGHVQASTPLLDRPLKGSVRLLSAGHLLPDLLFALRGPGGLRIDLQGRVSSGPGGGLRVRFDSLPDAPVSRFALSMDGGGRGLLSVAATDLCASPQRATVRFSAHDAAIAASRPRLVLRCGGHRRRHPQGRGR